MHRINKFSFDLKIFNTVIETAERSADLQSRLHTLHNGITLSVYTNVSRGLFERHKLVFSFMLCVAINKESGSITEAQWNFLLRGPIGSKGKKLK